MSSSLIPERSIIFSPILAATIGVEEAILLTQLHDWMPFNSCSHQRGYQWYELDNELLLELLPFWTARDIQRISKNLRDKGIILIDSPPFAEQGSFRFALNERSEEQLTTRQPLVPAHERGKDFYGANRISPHWQPSDELLQKIRRHHNIPQDFILDQVSEFVTYWLERNEVQHSWNAKFESHVKHAWRRHQAEPRFMQAQETPRPLAYHWLPDEEILQMLSNAGISDEFIQETIPEFVVYWRERGGVSSTWNHQFFKHVKKQWDRYLRALNSEREPTLINSNWRPSADFYDTLALARIDRDFADSLIAEFILYWEEKQEAHNAWNARFLKHVKYHWAKQHDMSESNAGQQNPYATGQKDNRGFIEKHTDRSWREGL